MWASFFLQGSFNLINFGKDWFLIDIDFWKPRVILSSNFNLFLEIFLEVHKCQVEMQTFQGKFIGFFSVCVR